MKQGKIFRIKPFLAASTLILGMSSAHAYLDLTGIPSSGIINDAIFSTPTSIVSGTGLIDSFVRIQQNGSEAGFNTDAANPSLDTKSGLWTHAITLGDLQTNKLTVNGIEYYEFVLDINQTNANSNLSLHELEFYLADVGNLNDYSAGLGTKVWDMDAGLDGDTYIELDYANFAGSGRLDMFALIPAAVFGTDLSKYIYLYSAFGIPSPSNDGYEEWARKTAGTFNPPCVGPNCGEQQIPEPATLALLGLGLAGLGWSRRRKH